MQSLNTTARGSGAGAITERANYSGRATTFGARRRRTLLSGILLGLLALSPAAAVVRAQSAGEAGEGAGETAFAASPVDAFDPGHGPSETVLAVAAQRDGRVLIGGRFTGVAGQPIAGAARLNADGTLDPTFRPQTNGTVHAVAVQADDKVLVAGSFSEINGQPHGGVARLNADGTLDHSFNPGVEGTVFAVLARKDGTVLVGGFFSKVGGQTRYCLARLNADGTLDSTFDTRGWADGYVFAIAERADGFLMVGGQFSYIGGQARARLARLTPDGPVDIFYQPQINGAVRALAMRPDGKVLVGGDFTQLGGQPRERLARLNADGSLDTSFNGGADNIVRAVATQADGRALVGGDFALVNGQARNRLARLDAGGALDVAFKPEPNAPVYALEAQADGRAFVGGEFTEIGALARTRVARLAAADRFYTGSEMVDHSFAPVGLGKGAVAVQPDGRVLVNGSFRTTYDRWTALARFNSDGTRDHSFAAWIGAPLGTRVHAVAVLPDGKILIGGEFKEVGGEPRNYLARLNADGSLDHTFTSFLQAAPGSVYAGVRIILVQPDGKIMVAGVFSQSTGQPRNYLARLHPDGALDDNFNQNPDGQVRSLALQPDGKILLGGFFSQVGGAARRGVARLNADGSMDYSFNPHVRGYVHVVAAQPDGRVLIGGDVWEVNGLPRMYLARLNHNGTTDGFTARTYRPVRALALQANGKIIFSSSDDRSGAYGRLNADGTADNTYSSPYVSQYIQQVVLQDDGRSLVGDHGLKRLLNNEAALQQLSVTQSPDDTASIRWTRGGGAPEVERVTFEVSVDGQTYTRVGDAARTAGGWVLDGAALPLGRIIYVRARGNHLATSYNIEIASGTATFESVRQLIMFAKPTDGPPTY